MYFKFFGCLFFKVHKIFIFNRKKIVKKAIKNITFKFYRLNDLLTNFNHELKNEFLNFKYKISYIFWSYMTFNFV